jgi:outer membrane protein
MKRLALVVLTLAPILLQAQEIEPQITPSVPPSTPGTLDLLGTLRLAEERDPIWLAAKAARQAAQEALPQARALYLPRLDLDANTTYNDVDNRLPAPFPSGARQYNSNAYGASLTQPLFRAQNRPVYEQAQAQVAQAEAQLGLARQDLILRVAQAYFDVLLAQDNVTLARSQKAAIAEQLEQAKRGFEVGTLTITDTHEAQARYDLAVSQEIAAANNLEIARQSLARLIGEPPPPLLPLRTELALSPPEPNDMQAWLQAAEKEALQVQAQEQAVEIARQEVSRNRRARLPTIDIVGRYRNSSDVQTFTGTAFPIDTETTALGLQLQMPLYQGGTISSQVREATANRDRAERGLEDARRQAVLATSQAFLGVTGGLSQVRALSQALVSSRTLLKSSRLGLEVGVRTNLDVLNAQQQLYNAERDLSSARYNSLVSQLSLQAAVARLSNQDVARINQLLGAAEPGGEGATSPPAP